MSDDPMEDAIGHPMHELDADEIAELVGDGTGHTLPMSDEPNDLNRNAELLRKIQAWKNLQPKPKGTDE